MNANLMNFQSNNRDTTRPPNGRGRGRGGRYSGGRGRGRFVRNPRVMRYCWSCGWCTHYGARCRTPREGHKTTATIENRLGGSVEGLPPNYVNEKGGRIYW